MGGYSFLVSLVEGKEMAKVCRKWSKAFHIEALHFPGFSKTPSEDSLFFSLYLYTIFWVGFLGVTNQVNDLPRVPTNFRQSREAIILGCDEGFHVGGFIPLG